MIDDETLQRCTSTDELRPLLLEAFVARNFDDVMDASDRYCALATAHRPQVRQRLHHYVVELTGAYVIAPRLGDRRISEWEDAFPELVGEDAPRTWQAFLLDRATFRREGLANAIALLERAVDELRKRPTPTR